MGACAGMRVCVQTQLEEANKLLHEEHRKRFRLEDENTRLGMEAARIRDLEALLGKERWVHAHAHLRGLRCKCWHASLLVC